MRAAKSIIGCGRPTVNSSAPRSIAVWSRLGAPWGSANFLSSRRVRPGRDAGVLPDVLRFGAVGAARVEPAQESLPRRELRVERPEPRPFAAARPSRRARADTAVAAASSSVATGWTLPPPASFAPRNSTTTGLPHARAAASARSATVGEGGFETITITRVAGSRASRSRPASSVVPPISSYTSRLPVPMACETPSPSAWMRQVTSCMPVPGCADDADRAAPHRVREAERHAADDRGAAVRAP